MRDKVIAKLINYQKKKYHLSTYASYCEPNWRMLVIQCEWIDRLTTNVCQSEESVREGTREENT